MLFDIEPGEETLLHTYLPTSIHDWVLIDLWGKMQRDGSIEGAMLPSAQSLLSFCHLLAKPDETHFAMDREGPYFCAWTEPIMSGISLGLWVREDKRKSRQCLIFGHKVLETLFKRFPIVIVITQNEMTRRFHQHFGFISSYEIPYIYNGNTAYISYLTKEKYTEKFFGPTLPLIPETVEESYSIGQFIQSLIGGN